MNMSFEGFGRIKTSDSFNPKKLKVYMFPTAYRSPSINSLVITCAETDIEAVDDYIDIMSSAGISPNEVRWENPRTLSYDYIFNNEFTEKLRGVQVLNMQESKNIFAMMPKAAPENIEESTPMPDITPEPKVNTYINNLKLASDKFTKDKKEKDVINKIITRINNDNSDNNK